MIPTYQEIMYPLMKLLADNKEHKLKDIVDTLAIQYGLSQDDRKELLPSGQQSIFNSRVGWAKTYLNKAGLVDVPKRAVYVISQLGLTTMGKNPTKIDNTFLKQFPSFVEFTTTVTNVNSATISKSTALPTQVCESLTPEEALDDAYQQISKSLADELLSKVLELSPAFFEKLVVELIVKMGYGGSIQDAGAAIGKSGDEGIDGTIKEDRLGLDVIYIQAKRWKPGNVVGRPELQKFVGALAGQGAKKGIFLTTSSFTKEAEEYNPKNDTKIIRINGKQLAQLMMEYSLGCSTHKTYEIKKIDSDYFEDV